MRRKAKTYGPHDLVSEAENLYCLGSCYFLWQNQNTPLYLKALLCYILDISLKVTEGYKNYENMSSPVLFYSFILFFFLLILVFDYIGSQCGKAED